MERRFAKAKALMPGGVSSPVRAFKAVGGTPIFFERGSGALIYDADGKEYVDFVGSWGPLIVGHSHPKVVEAIRDQAGKGTTFGAPTELETELAQRIVERFPACEKVRFVSSGTEATMSAIRLARAVTGKSVLVKIEGCYHGHADSLLVKAGSGVLTLGIPGSPGVPSDLAALTVTIPFGDAAALQCVLAERAGHVAAVIVEPVAGNMGVVPPPTGWLKELRRLTAENDVILIFDEVMTGFRVDRGGAQTLYGVEPDLSCFGKIVGGGLPVGAYGGRAKFMDQVAPSGPVYQAGTLSGNPLAMRAGIATLELLDEPGVYEALEKASAALEAGLDAAAKAAGVPAVINRVGSMLTAFFTDGPVTDYASATRSDTKRYAAFHRAMLDRGVYLAPSQFEALFVSTAHEPAIIERAVATAREALQAIAR